MSPAPALAADKARLLSDGTVIPAHPLALDADRRLDERRQRALTRYYLDAGAGGLAVGVHTTQFEIRAPDHGLLEPVLALAAATADEHAGRPPLLVAGVCGPAGQAVAEAELAASLGYDCALLSPGGLAGLSEAELLDRARAVTEVLPVLGFYLQPAVGGRPLGYRFWRDLAELPGLVGVKVAPFNRYDTLDVVRAVATSDRADDIALYTGNDDSIVADLLANYRWEVEGRPREKAIVGGLLGQWAVWTREAVGLLDRCRVARRAGVVPADLLVDGTRLTDANAAIFDAANGFRGCIPGVHEILRRQGLLAGRWALDPELDLSPGQADEIDRVRAEHPALADDDFVRAHLDGWLR